MSERGSEPGSMGRSCLVSRGSDGRDAAGRPHVCERGSFRVASSRVRVRGKGSWTPTSSRGASPLPKCGWGGVRGG